MTSDDNSNTGQLSGSFGVGKAGTSNFGSLVHPEADYILETCFGILSKIPTGKKLLEIKERYTVPISVLSGREVIYTTPDDLSLIIFVTPDFDTAPEIVSMILGTGLRDMEHSVMGYRRPSQDSDPVEYASMTFSKTLDIITNMCIIADELKEELGYSKPLDIVHELGHGDIYKAYKDKLPHEDLVNVFIEGNRKALNEEGN